MSDSAWHRTVKFVEKTRKKIVKATLPKAKPKPRPKPKPKPKKQKANFKKKVTKTLKQRGIDRD